MNVVLRDLGLVDYVQCWQAMQQFTSERGIASADEFWLVQHPPVFTLGRAGKREHVLAARDIPVLNTDRGGQVTYHGPGQLISYVLVNVRRLNIGPRELVRRIEQGVIDYLAGLGIRAERRGGAPGVYVNGAKISALGLRIRNGCSYHGVSLNVALDLEPYQRINPCGYPGLETTQIADHGGPTSCAEVQLTFVPALINNIYPDMVVRAEYSAEPASRLSARTAEAMN